MAKQTQYKPAFKKPNPQNIQIRYEAMDLVAFTLDDGAEILMTAQQAFDMRNAITSVLQ